MYYASVFPTDWPTTPSADTLPGVLFYKSTDYASLSNVYRKKGQVGGFETGFVTLSEGYLKEMRAFNYTAQLQVSVLGTFKSWVEIDDSELYSRTNASAVNNGGLLTPHITCSLRHSLPSD